MANVLHDPQHVILFHGGLRKLIIACINISHAGNVTLHTWFDKSIMLDHIISYHIIS